jgi:AAHS family 4-hydroxybenzoate transporter-like MFS transporter
MTWMMLVTTAFWTPALLQLAGFPASIGASALAFSSAGGVVGTLAIGSLVGRLRVRQALLMSLPFASVFLLTLGFVAQARFGGFVAVATMAGLAGFFSSAAGGLILAISAEIYPAEIRATGIGWALGFGRIGSIVGPTVLGILVASRLSVSWIYSVLAGAALIGAVLILFLPRNRSVI